MAKTRDGQARSMSRPRQFERGGVNALALHGDDIDKSPHTSKFTDAFVDSGSNQMAWSHHPDEVVTPHPRKDDCERVQTGA